MKPTYSKNNYFSPNYPYRDISKQKVLVTGGLGYIGSVLTKRLLERGYSVRVADCLRWGGSVPATFLANPRFKFIKGDLREDGLQQRALIGVDAVVHLAAIVGGPACKKEPDLAQEVNWGVSKSIFDRASAMEIKRFIFSSTCSNYGRMPDAEGYIDETGLLNPISLYARLKVRFEEYLLHSVPGAMTATSLRFATAYGISDRMRFDLTVNEFVKEAVLGRELIVYGQEFWRPYCNVEDLADACICVLEADSSLIDREVFNVGDTVENYQKQDIVRLIAEYIPEMKVTFVHKEEDPRNYKVNFNKIKDRLNFQISKRLRSGIDEIRCFLNRGVLGDPDSSQYRNS